MASACVSFVSIREPVGGFSWRSTAASGDPWQPSQSLTARLEEADARVAGRLALYSEGGVLNDDAELLYDSTTDTLSVARLSSFTATGAIPDGGRINIQLPDGWTIDDTPGSSVTVKFNGKSIAATTGAFRDAPNTWKALLPATAASLTFLA